MIEGVRVEDDGLGSCHGQGEEHEQDRDAASPPEEGPMICGDPGPVHRIRAFTTRA